MSERSGSGHDEGNNLRECFPLEHLKALADDPCGCRVLSSMVQAIQVAHFGRPRRPEDVVKSGGASETVP